MAMKLVFMGTPQFAVPPLEFLLVRHEVLAVFCQPDRPAGRGGKMALPPVKQVAVARQIPVYQPEKLKREEWESILRRLSADVYIVVAYGKMLPNWLFTIPPFGAINLHASLLPRYRGAAPINWAIVHGETVTGLSTMQIAEGMDAGDILLQQEAEISAEMTAPELHDLLSHLGGALLGRTLELLARGELIPHPQDSALATYAPLLKKEDGLLDWSRSVEDIYNQIRGLNPWPGTYTSLEGDGLRIWRAVPRSNYAHCSVPGTLIHDPALGACIQCDSGGLQLLEVQPENRKRISGQDFLNGLRLAPGQTRKLGG
jgi:methionyl-tRNA formyltransferase